LQDQVAKKRKKAGSLDAGPEALAIGHGRPTFKTGEDVP